jgi:hypothetical protein
MTLLLGRADSKGERESTMLAVDQDLYGNLDELINTQPDASWKHWAEDPGAPSHLLFSHDFFF